MQEQIKYTFSAFMEYCESCSDFYRKLKPSINARLKLLMNVILSGWVNTLVGGQKEGAKGFMFFIINVDLTEEGLCKWCLLH